MISSDASASTFLWDASSGEVITEVTGQWGWWAPAGDVIETKWVAGVRSGPTVYTAWRIEAVAEATRVGGWLPPHRRTADYHKKTRHRDQGLILMPGIPPHYLSCHPMRARRFVAAKESESGKVQLWDRVAQRPRATLGYAVDSLRYYDTSANGDTVVIVTMDTKVHLWREGRPRLQALVGITARRAVLSRDGAVLLVVHDIGGKARRDSVTALRLTETPRVIGRAVVSRTARESVALSWDGHLVVCGGIDGTISVYATTTGDTRPGDE
jgi:WD40 repeat protein